VAQQHQRKKKRKGTAIAQKEDKKNCCSLFLSPRFLVSRHFFIVALPATGIPEAPFLAARHCVNPST
jgi:hypothetical protein